MANEAPTDDEERQRAKEIDRASKLLTFLEIPHTVTPIFGLERMSILDLYDILMDEERLKVIVSKLKMKAFW